tara:strand:- start:85 stop:402 length:318 start_codon:yes stop_codon:yes gene_type:complete
MQENKDYELTPTENDHWDIRILTGDYIETVFSFGAIKVEDESLRYNAAVASHQLGDDWDPDADLDWHKTTGAILYDVLERTLGDDENTDNGLTGKRQEHPSQTVL